MCKRAVKDKADTLEFVPGHLNTQEMCEKVVEERSYMLEDVPDQYKTQEMCINAVEKVPRVLRHAPDYFKSKRMCERAVEDDLWQLKYVPDCFVTHQQLKIWHDSDDYCCDDKLIEWYDGYKKTNGPKSLNKRRALAHCLASIKMLGLACS